MKPFYGIVSVAVVCLWCFMCGAFIHASLNPKEWEMITRIFLVAMATFGSAAALDFVNNHYIKDDQ